MLHLRWDYQGALLQTRLGGCCLSSLDAPADRLPYTQSQGFGTIQTTSILTSCYSCFHAPAWCLCNRSLRARAYRDLWYRQEQGQRRITLSGMPCAPILRRAHNDHHIAFPCYPIHRCDVTPESRAVWNSRPRRPELPRRRTAGGWFRLDLRRPPQVGLCDRDTQGG